MSSDMSRRHFLAVVVISMRPGPTSLAMTTVVRPVRTRTDLARFIGLPYRLHARDPNWVPPLRRDVRTLLSRAANPFFRHAEAEYYLAERNGAVVGRIAAVANQLHNGTG